MAKKYELSAQEKQKMASRINYFRTMPNLVLKYASDVEHGQRTITNEFTHHEEKATVVGGRVMLLNCN